MERYADTSGRPDLLFSQSRAPTAGIPTTSRRQLQHGSRQMLLLTTGRHLLFTRRNLPGVTTTEQPQSEQSDVLDLWNNLPATARGVSITGIVMYALTLIVDIAYGQSFSWYVTMGLLIWPLIVVAWLLVIWTAFVVFSMARVLFEPKTAAKEDIGKTLTKIIIFIPAVIGTALIVVEVFVNDIFSTSSKEDKED